MAHPDYISAREDAVAAIVEYGTAAEVYMPGVHDPIEGGSTPAVLVGPAHVLVTEYSDRATDGERIKPGDKSFLMVADFAISGEHIIRLNGVDWAVQRVREVNPDASPLAILSKVQVRR